ncbi:Tol-Pal system beta propeller repeat protein TolB [Hydrogenovibrio sp. SC-1]|uniref:Tol-Pal system beta propeller repeat protein TolB n=1 Tax=Hydrogenovibrio sp. SC-1 TaxID=2065820 RepID=UPI000C7E01E1|nr:Tol-Pal system beta propeller repeat protein TolB [Hydrogenovibrio sp. SC-1]PLA74756.1 Tol-Pal system beta propeller repeat protein TolB [Hydrogenovibrio sp. SC-1]
MLLLTKRKFFLVCVLWMVSLSSRAELTIQIDQSSASALPIALIPFEFEGKGLRPEAMSQIIGQNLFRTGKFKALDESQLPAKPNHLKAIQFDRWKALGVDNLLMGRLIETKNGLYQIEMRFVDILRKEQIMGKRWTGITKSNLRQVAHKITDLIYKELTGIQGAFNTKIAYVTVKTKNNNRHFSLEVADADGHNSHPILRSTNPIMSPSWSPDGKQLAYVTFENGRSEIVVQSLDGLKREIIASYKGINGAPAWSPDGKKMALTLSKDGSADVYLMDMKTRHLRRLTRNWAIETEAVWAPNGHSLFFNSDRRGQPQVFQVFLDTGEIRRVSFIGGYNANPAVSPDGRYVAMVHGHKGFHIGLLDLYNETFNVITKTYLDESPSFSPNGEMILYAMNQAGLGKLAVVSIDSSVTQVLSVQDGEVRAPSWGPLLNE